MPYRWKALRAELSSQYNSKWQWKIGKWYKCNGGLVLCKNGFHCSRYIPEAMRYVYMEILAKVEVKGEHLDDNDKSVWREMRIIKAWEWNSLDSVAFAIYCAKRVLPIFEKKYPQDKRPREAIRISELFLNNKTNARAAYAAAHAAAHAAHADHAAYAAEIKKQHTWILRRIPKLKEVKSNG